MGCGKLSKVKDFSYKDGLYTVEQLQLIGIDIKSAFERNSGVKTVFKEDIDDANNQLAMQRNSRHHDIIKNSDSIIRHSRNNKERAHVYEMKADYYFKYGTQLLNMSDAENFTMFRKALVDYTTANELDKDNRNSLLGILKCLVQLHQYKTCLDRLEKLSTDKDLTNNPEFLILYGICNRKCSKIWQSDSYFPSRLESAIKLEKAKSGLTQALNLDALNTIAAKELKIVENLIGLREAYNRDIYKYIEPMKKNVSNYEQSTTRNNSPENELYKILSINAGGVKGILPIMLMCELEKRCNRLLPDVFNMFAGSSTGAIIGTMATLPKQVDSAKPRYSAFDMLDFFIEDCRNIFSSPSTLNRIFSQKYSNRNAYNVFKRHCNGLYLAETLNALIIPSLYCDIVTYTEYFTNYAARSSEQKNVPLVDVLMAATAAPTFFEPYKIAGLGCFLDGSLTTANPCKKAYEEAVYTFNKSDKDIFMISLGTGQVACDMYAENFGAKGQMHLYANTPKYMMMAQTHNAEIYMSKILGNRFKYLEFYFEENIPMDMHGYIPDLLEIGTQYVEDKSDDINKIVEILLEH
jgi:patatin-like phospholipase/acyl hydrolase